MAVDTPDCTEYKHSHGYTINPIPLGEFKSDPILAPKNCLNPLK